MGKQYSHLCAMLLFFFFCQPTYNNTISPVESFSVASNRFLFGPSTTQSLVKIVKHCKLLLEAVSAPSLCFLLLWHFPHFLTQEGDSRRSERCGCGFCRSRWWRSDLWHSSIFEGCKTIRESEWVFWRWLNKDGQLNMSLQKKKKKGKNYWEIISHLWR